MALTQINYEGNAYNLSYEMINPDQKKTLLILHGWGANKELMKQAFEKQFHNFCHLYLDLPGFGNSSIVKALKSNDYVNIIKEFLKEKKINIDVFLGHSFGGKIAALLALEFKNSKLVLLSNSGILAPKSLKVRFKIIVFKFLKTIGLGRFYRYFASKDGANLSPLMYQTFKNVVDENMSHLFSKIDTKTLIFWGINDQATPLKSGETMHHLIKNSQFYPLDGDHFFFLKHAAFIAEKLKDDNAD
ncbi:alpha/beta fold hydrolase [Campylobacter estrildidarum]|uniref:2-hydroxy-6-oxohepta-2,4-dienoate hydrolase n=1 Tax=Campylobacter estrildidarum TaxID=2510189 RepID=A0A4U7BPJ7_9BACT|nr:alpha/beta hydrolase [Campylobacter estrildidarum]TKX30017.1 2-hydroxy-6-oxohepta-2,4-dienoate hydrolase [Campylobacter estrildidarum]